MNIARDIADSLVNVELIEIKDEFSTCTVSCKVLDLNLHQNSSVRLELANAAVQKHNLEYDVCINLADSPAIEFDQTTDFISIAQQIEEQAPFYDRTDENTLTVKILKKKSQETNNTTHIFDVKSYLDTWQKKNLSDILDYLISFDCDSRVTFKFWEPIKDFNSSRYYFTSNVDSELPVSDISERKKIFEKRNKSCHFTNDAGYKFIPEDFHLLNDSDLNEIKNKFNKLLVVFTIIFLSDFSEIISIEKGKLSLDYKMKGYRLIASSIDSNSIETSSAEELYYIYQWVYNQGNFVDKIGLARNIISIHMLGTEITSLGQGALKSIESAYDIYLKENVKQYIEIKNKISELLITQADKASDITKNMFTTFKTSFWSIVTFFITVILVKLVTTKGEGNIISGEIFSITIVFVIFSFIYLILTHNEVDEEKARLFERYDTIKLRYKDLLNEDDLNKVINTEDLKEKDGRYIEKRKRTYRYTWMVFNVLTVLIVGVLYWHGVGSKTVNSQKNNSTTTVESTNTTKNQSSVISEKNSN